VVRTVLHSPPLIQPSSSHSARPGEIICDPACGTGGFPCCHDSSARDRTSTRTKEASQTESNTSFELVDNVTRLCR